MSATQGYVSLPIVESVNIKNVTLYRENPDINLTFGDGVFCLAGANGLGKSTFLALVNYGITGIVADPDRKFMSLKEYYQHSVDYSPEYFQGRVFELERHLAEVTVDMTVGSVRYTLTRGLFEPESLRSLRILNQATGESQTWTAEVADESVGRSIHEEYVAHVTKDTNLGSYQQLVFLQLFLLTFDERRRLLFWDPEITRRALLLAFGVDAEKAGNVDEWSRKADRLESQARNAQYQATTARQRQQELRTRTDTAKILDEDLVLRYRELAEDRDETERVREYKSREVADAQLVTTRLTAKQHALVNDYDKAFNDRLQPGADPRQNPIVTVLIEQHKCGICGNQGDDIHQAVVQLLEERLCPLCRSSTERAAPSSKNFVELERLDEALDSIKREIDVAQTTLSRLTAELQTAEDRFGAARQKLFSFQKANGITSNDVEAYEADSTVNAMLDQLEAERRAAIDRRDDFREHRDKFRRMIEPVQNELAERYLEAERSFVPTFQRLARDFLGLDLLINMEQRSRGVELALEIDGTRRRMTTQLSESQRYFVDIALRMALTQHMVGEGNPSCLYIDTPEGSLDIAYEYRAGKMFGRFANDGNRLVMTANINSSRLVQQLASICRSDRMKVVRMTEWTTLSEVQAESEKLFDEAYQLIEMALRGEQE